MVSKLLVYMTFSEFAYFIFMSENRIFSSAWAALLFEYLEYFQMNKELARDLRHIEWAARQHRQLKDWGQYIMQKSLPVSWRRIASWSCSFFNLVIDRPAVKIHRKAERLYFYPDGNSKIRSFVVKMVFFFLFFQVREVPHFSGIGRERYLILTGIDFSIFRWFFSFFEK